MTDLPLEAVRIAFRGRLTRSALSQSQSLPSRLGPALTHQNLTSLPKAEVFEKHFWAEDEKKSSSDCAAISSSASSHLLLQTSVSTSIVSRGESSCPTSRQHAAQEGEILRSCSQALLAWSGFGSGANDGFFSEMPKGAMRILQGAKVQEAHRAKLQAKKKAEQEALTRAKGKAKASETSTGDGTTTRLLELTIRPGEKLRDFNARVEQAMASDVRASFRSATRSQINARKRDVGSFVLQASIQMPTPTTSNSRSRLARPKLTRQLPCKQANLPGTT